MAIDVTSALKQAILDRRQREENSVKSTDAQAIIDAAQNKLSNVEKMLIDTVEETFADKKFLDALKEATKENMLDIVVEDFKKQMNSKISKSFSAENVVEKAVQKDLKNNALSISAYNWEYKNEEQTNKQKDDLVFKIKISCAANQERLSLSHGVVLAWLNYGNGQTTLEQFNAELTGAYSDAYNVYEAKDKNGGLGKYNENLIRREIRESQVVTIAYLTEKEKEQKTVKQGFDKTLGLAAKSKKDQKIS